MSRYELLMVDSGDVEWDVFLELTEEEAEAFRVRLQAVYDADYITRFDLNMLPDEDSVGEAEVLDIIRDGLAQESDRHDLETLWTEAGKKA